ncbi:AraC family transcriptional regulator [Aquabacterium soli]|jgi:AraC-like DNA-binding protein|uniref:AraC family transcriptional regulator n=1 Tax=Aquabacterium soli TaxID=2493092 RepID=A0A426V698_9BURK|nr:AraC family transcriptional regulator [Aquabacterium soli]RRS02361.1 AraC family transcriptional regulator [Aquabacterium soli]
MPVNPQISPAVLRQAAAELEDRSGDSSSLFRGLGLSEHAINADLDFLVSYRQASVVLRRAMRLMAGGELGFNVGRRRSAVATGLAGLGFLASSNLNDAYGLVASYPWAFGCPLHVHNRLDAQGNLYTEATPQFPDPELDTFWIEEFFCSMTVLARELLGPAFKPGRLEFKAARPAHAARMKSFVGCDVQYGRGANRMVTEAACALTMSVSADTVVKRSVLDTLERFRVQPRRSDICETVGQLLREQVGAPPTLAQLATLLNTSERTLRRKLVEQSTSYHQLLDGARRDQVIALLRDTSIPINEVSASLGFSDVRNFRRAVKRWTGQAPTSVRKQT